MGKENKTDQVRFRVTKAEKEKLEKRADVAGLTLSQYARTLVVGAPAPKERLPADVIRSIIGVATNLNQIARNANAGHYEKESIQELIKTLRNALL